uniref:Uncharacterized protein n=1 Tax=Rhizophora mucronata TaxID=61149 RepID=A0A2P2NBI1_RHIMU
MHDIFRNQERDINPYIILTIRRDPEWAMQDSYL